MDHSIISISEYESFETVSPLNYWGEGHVAEVAHDDGYWLRLFNPYIHPCFKHMWSSSLCEALRGGTGMTKPWSLPSRISGKIMQSGWRKNNNRTLWDSVQKHKELSHESYTFREHEDWSAPWQSKQTSCKRQHLKII